MANSCSDLFILIYVSPCMHAPHCPAEARVRTAFWIDSKLTVVSGVSLLRWTAKYTKLAAFNTVTSHRSIARILKLRYTVFTIRLRP